MTKNEKDKHRLMDVCLKEDANGGVEDAQLLREVDRMIDAGEGATRRTTEEPARRNWWLAAAALLLISGGSAFHIFSSGQGDPPRTAENINPQSERQLPDLWQDSITPPQQAALVVAKRKELLARMKAAEEPARELMKAAEARSIELMRAAGERNKNLMRVAQHQDDSDPASRYDMVLRIEDVISATDGTPAKLSFTYKHGDKEVTEHYATGENWPAESDSAPFFLPDTVHGRKGIAVYVGRLADYLTRAGANLEENSSLMVNANHRENERIQMPNIPPLASDFALILRDTRDLTAFPKGFSLLTPFRLYLADDVNVVPSGGDALALVYPPVEILAPEKRFGLEQPMLLSFDGQLNHLAKDGGSVVRPLDLSSGGDGASQWENVTIQGSLYSTGTATEGAISLDRLASRQGIALSSGLTVGGVFTGDLPSGGEYEASNTGFFPLPIRVESQAALAALPVPASLEEYAAAKREYDEAVAKLNRMIGVRGPDDRGEQPGLSRERYGRPNDQPWNAPWYEPLSTFSVDVDTASYTNLRRMLRERHAIPRGAVRLEECLNYFDYGYAAPVKGGPFSVHVDMATCPWEEKHHLVKIGLKGKEVATNGRPPSNLVFLIDVSGSMQDATKLPLLVQSMKVLVEELDERDSVGIVVYAGSAGTVLEPTMVEGEGRDAIVAALDGLSAGGSTAGAAGIKGAYELAAKHYRKDGVNRVILATDGDFNVGTSSQEALVDLVKEEAKSGVYLSVLGFGSGNLNDSMMEAVTNAGNGNYFYVDTLREGRKVFLQNLSGTLVTIAKDVKLQVEFNPRRVAAYRLIGYANRVLRDQDFNNDKIDAGDIGAGHTVTALYEIVPLGAEVPDIGSVDPLKYQQLAKRKVTNSAEWMTLKLRYKKPDGNKSALLELPVVSDPVDWRTASPDFLFAAGVALFGEKLRRSDKTGEATWEQVRELARLGVGVDRHGHRAEFQELVGLASRAVPDRAPAQPVPDAVEAPPAE